MAMPEQSPRTLILARPLTLLETMDLGQHFEDRPFRVGSDGAFIHDVTSEGPGTSRSRRASWPAFPRATQRSRR